MLLEVDRSGRNEASVRGPGRESLVRVNTIPMLRGTSGGNADQMPDSAADLVPSRPSLPKLREAAAVCRACPLWEQATQTVFGAGTRTSAAVFVGEQPGDREDIEGKPFVGPAGRILDEALAQAGIDRRAVYVTNAVKHFKWEPRGKRRIHAKPNWSELAACRPWLEAELAVVRPEVLVCLGATAAQSLLGRQFRVTKQRGEWLDSDLAEHVTATIHPSSILRQRDEESRHEEMNKFVEDLKLVASVLNQPEAKTQRSWT
jgi:uracil-DNA glycosylase